MATEVEKKATVSKKTVTESTWKRLIKVAEFRMVLYVIPVALILLVVSLLLNANK
jgi:hypothetical protein